MITTFLDIEERLASLSQSGDPLEALTTAVDFEVFRSVLERAVPRADRSRGGRPPFDHVLMFKVLILKSIHGLSYEQTEFYIRDRLSWMRLLGLSFSQLVPDENTIRDFAEALTKADAMKTLFAHFDAALRDRGYLAMDGQVNTGAQMVSLCCDAWNNLIDRPWKIMSIGHRQWAHGF